MLGPRKNNYPIYIDTPIDDTLTKSLRLHYMVFQVITAPVSKKI
jgi:hypothetical protein